MKTLLPITLIASLALNARANEDAPPTGDIGGIKRVDEAEPYSVKHQIYARYVVGGQRSERNGGWGPSGNFPHVLGADDKFGEPGKLSIAVAADEPLRVGKFEAVRLRVVNRSDERTFFSAIDSHLFMVQEALDDKGKWKAIERIPHGSGPRDCAVGFHRISLRPGEYWNLAAPRYSGSIKTKLRFRLDLGKNDGRFPQPGGKLIYSDEFVGTINPEQFHRGAATAFDLNAP